MDVTSKWNETWTRLASEPPFRILVRAMLKRLNVGVRTRAFWELSARPAYLLGLVIAAQAAHEQRVSEISAIEFGVAAGEGLLALQEEATAVEAEMRVGIKVFGFDMGPQGLPSLIGDYRDHPDAWRSGDYPMNEATLRKQLTKRTTLVVGNVRETVPQFFENCRPPPLGFVAFDLDLYSSTRAALQVFTLPGKTMLRQVPLYFDDIDFLFNHKFAGELLAIREFNQTSAQVKIDRWYGVRNGRPFPERPFLDKLFVAHDLEAISRATLDRDVGTLPLNR